MGLPVTGIIVCGLLAFFLSGYGLTYGQELITDQVTIAVEGGHVFGITSGEGIARKLLTSGEEILVIEARGVTGFVQTTKRLLGFSGQLQRWVEFPLSTAEHILQWIVTPRMIMVVGTRQGYGFQSHLARWKYEAWGADETIEGMRAKSYVGVIMTNRRALGFSAVTGGFFSQVVPRVLSEEHIHINDHIVVITMETRTFIFRSGLAIWTEIP